MKIKSWTGDEVDARVGMVVKLGNPADCCSVKYAGTRHIVNSLCDAELFDYECIMLHCPFQVGDAIQGLSKANYCWWPDTYRADIENDYLLIRHTNPSLRTSVEYKV